MIPGSEANSDWLRAKSFCKLMNVSNVWKRLQCYVMLNNIGLYVSLFYVKYTIVASIFKSIWSSVILCLKTRTTSSTSASLRSALSKFYANTKLYNYHHRIFVYFHGIVSNAFYTTF